MNYNLPTKRQAIALLLKSGCSQEVIEHCKAVAKTATELAKNCKKKGNTLWQGQYC